MMNQRIQDAVRIANQYRAEHDGEIPSLVIAHGKDETFTIVGKFRPDERGGGALTREDQKQFVGVMRIVFEMHGVTSYEVVTKPEVNNQALGLTQNLLSVFTVDAKGSYGEFFEIEDEELIPCYSNMEITSWFSQMLPTGFNVEIDAKTKKNINKYMEACRYVPAPEPVYLDEDFDAFEMLNASLA